jgi:hypothetical protein
LTKVVVLKSIVGEADFVWSNAKRPLSFQPSEPLGAFPHPRSSPAAEINPESPALNHLEVNVPTAYLRMVKDHVRPMVTANDCKRLLQKPYLGLVRVRNLDDEFKRVRNSAGIQKRCHGVRERDYIGSN